jgi:hypothetical protein
VANYGLVIYSGTDHSVLAKFDLATLHLQESDAGRQFRDCLHIARTSAACHKPGNKKNPV